MVLQVILILVVIIFIAYSFGVGGEIIDDVVADVRENVVKQKDVADPAIIDVANFAADTGTRICDLSLKFYGTMTPVDPNSFDPFNFGEERWIWHGDIKADLDFIDFLNIGGDGWVGDRRIVTYEWLCPTVNVSAASIFWNLRENALELFGGTGTFTPQKLDLGNVINGIAELTNLDQPETSGEVVRYFFQAESLNTGKLMIDKNGFGLDNKPFQSNEKLPNGADFPYDYIINIRLQDVTEDDYLLKFWSNDYEMNAQNAGFRFEYYLCSPFSQATSEIGVVTGKTIFGETFTVVIDDDRVGSFVKEGC